MQTKDDRAPNFYCHGCDTLYYDAVLFFSSPLAQEVNGHTYPVKGCKACVAVPGRIRAAYNAFLKGQGR